MKHYEIRNEYFHILPRGMDIVVNRPEGETPYSSIAVLANHNGKYLFHFDVLREIAKRGFITAGMPSSSNNKHLEERMLDIKAGVEFMRKFPGVKKVLLLGHSQGGCLTSCYQYIAENGTERFTSVERLVPFPLLPALPPADGLMLVDANHGIMEFMGFDPAIRSLDSGFDRDPELDLYNPENGYVPGNSHYSDEFARKFTNAQVKFYREILDYAKQKAEDIRLGKGRVADDDVVVLPGCSQRSTHNKLFFQDNRFLSRTRGPRPLLHADGSVTEEVVRTLRKRKDSVPSKFYHGGTFIRTVNELLSEELQFEDDYYLTEDEVCGLVKEFNPWSTRANVRGIHVPLLCEGNQGNHEFVNIDRTYDEAVSEDKTIIMLAGAGHGFEPMENSEEYKDVQTTPAAVFADFAAEWLSKPGRFLP